VLLSKKPSVDCEHLRIKRADQSKIMFRNNDESAITRLCVEYGRGIHRENFLKARRTQRPQRVVARDDLQRLKPQSLAEGNSAT